MFWTG